MTIDSIISVAIFAIVLIVLISPLFGVEEGISEQKQEIDRQNFAKQKETLFASIKDLELDHQLKKVSDEDFRELYDDALLEGAGLMKKMEKK